jgi:nucleoside-specific outer membrane channel protein Tsx
LGSEVHDLIEAAGGGDYEIGTGWSVSYPVSGGSMGYTYGELGIWAFTYELDHHSLPEICEEFLTSMLFLGEWISDCNSNGMPDADEIATGTSDDRNTNGVPDECEHPGYCVAPESAKLRASDGDAEDYFGTSVALSGDTTLVGVPYDSDQFLDAGAAYVLQLDAADGVEEYKLIASDGAESDLFGHSVAVSGNTALVGAPGDDDSGDESGSAYVFRFDGSAWVEEAKLTASDGNESDGFGGAVATSGDSPQWALVGATWADGGRGGRGAAYVYRFDGSNWVEQAKLVAFGDTPGLMFGTAVGITGESPARAIVGDFRDFANGYGSGAAYMFRFDGSDWIEDAKLTASDGVEYDTLGQSVAVVGETALVGAPGDDVYGYSSGSAYVFRFNGTGWLEEARLAPFDGAESDHFGCSVAVSGSSPQFALIGADLDDDNGRDSGSAYVFGFNGETWRETAKLTASDGTPDDHFGRSVAISGNTVLVGAPRYTYQVSHLGTAYVFRGVSTDCNDNLTSDMCEMATGMSGDCNGNGTPDDCDITFGTSKDRFPRAWGGDGGPYECQTFRPTSKWARPPKSRSLTPKRLTQSHRAPY